jgi:hypothetical protein
MAHAKVAIVILAGTDTHESLARVVNALEAVKEFSEGGDDVRLVFDGAGVAWVPELLMPEHKLHKLYAAVKDRVAGVCDYCANAFGVHAAVKSSGTLLSADFDGHPSFRQLIASGYQVITF